MIKTLKDPDREDILATSAANEPVLILDTLKHYPDIACLTPQYLAKNHGEKEILLNISQVEQEKTQHLKTSLKKFVRYILELDNKKVDSAKNFYFAESMKFADRIGVDDDLHEFLKEMCLPHRAVFTQYAFWLAPRGTKTGLHYDIDHRNYLIQVYGTKVCFLAHPNQTPFMYPSEKFEHEGKVSDVNFFKPDYQKYPLFKHAKFEKVILKPGQILYIPAKWWHAVYNPTGIAAVSCRFETPESKIKQFPEWVKFNLHRLGLYKKGNCTCCGEGTHRW